MNVLILGAGGREHCLAWKIKQSPRLRKLFVAPGNAGTEQIATNININININDFEQVKNAVCKYKIELVVVGPEEPLVNGIYDFFKEDETLKNIKIIAPSKKAAQLEGSKDFAKEFMFKYNIPTAKYQSFTKETMEQAFHFLDTMSPPYVLKADGLAAGKGVIIENKLTAAKITLEQMLNGKFGQASKKVVIEEFLKGIECSYFVLTDSKDYVILPEAKDYKRVGEGDTGLNTGGMGAVSPVPFVNNDFKRKVEDRIIKPTINGLIKENINYTGFIFFGLINVNSNPYVIEYNVRMGDPETQVVIPRINNDMIELLLSTAQQKLGYTNISISDEKAATVVLVSKGYPQEYEKDKKIIGLEQIDSSIVFHAATKRVDAEILSNGGRVLAVTSLAEDMDEAVSNSIKSISKISFDNKYFRKDIGKDLKIS